MAQPSNNETHVKKNDFVSFSSLSLSLSSPRHPIRKVREAKKNGGRRSSSSAATHFMQIMQMMSIMQITPRRRSRGDTKIVRTTLCRPGAGSAPLFCSLFFLRFSFVLFYRVVTEFRSATSSKRLTRFSVDFFLFILVLVGFFFCSISSSFCCRLSAIAPPPTDAPRRPISHSRSLFPCKNSRQ